MRSPTAAPPGRSDGPLPADSVARAIVLGFAHMLYHAQRADLETSKLYRPASPTGNRCKFCDAFLEPAASRSGRRRGGTRRAGPRLRTPPDARTAPPRLPKGPDR